ncbi:MAG: CHAT domain-containing protein [Candidatus Microthrix sp.]|nr:CHAT domain-containing protein [Candidatus Microthrix sp.]
MSRCVLVPDIRQPQAALARHKGPTAPTFLPLGAAGRTLHSPPRPRRVAPRGARRRSSRQPRESCSDTPQAAAVAPASQSIVLSDGEGGLVRLFAYEVLSLDLRGLEVVSLGACETGLGRVDLFGNLRGITSSLLARGVRCVIAALWPVSDAAAELFFGTFYRELAAGTDALGLPAAQLDSLSFQRHCAVCIGSRGKSSSLRSARLDA